MDNLIVVGNVVSFDELSLHCFPNSTAHDPDTLLGMDVEITKDCISPSQEKLNGRLKMLGLSNLKSVNTPLSIAIQLKSDTPEEKK